MPEWPKLEARKAEAGAEFLGMGQPANPRWFGRRSVAVDLDVA